MEYSSESYLAAENTLRETDTDVMSEKGKQKASLMDQLLSDEEEEDVEDENDYDDDDEDAEDDIDEEEEEEDDSDEEGQLLDSCHGRLVSHGYNLYTVDSYVSHGYNLYTVDSYVSHGYNLYTVDSCQTIKH
jgi:hypothetical protein